ncbi:MAG: hypothetical protein IT211_03175, partial [Armatimonadetes bacterium]|nr:hypothetical protein [Armatimonadota bacterium]
MNRERRTNTRQRSRAPAWVAVALLLLVSSSRCYAQDGQPRNPDAVGFTTVGVHELNDCKQGKGRLTGILYPLGKLSKNGPVAWLLQHERCDTLVPNSGYPSDLWLVQSVNGVIPPLDDHQVIGATELGSETRLVGWGDYDGNGIVDIVVDIYRFNDTSFGNTQGYGLASVAVFYGDSNYRYSLQDTVRLSNGTEAWTGAGVAVSYDVNNDGADELLMWSGSGWLTGKRFIPQPQIVGFAGTPGKKWGRDGASNRRVWEWWRVPEVLPSNSFGYWERRDADCDGVQDLVIYTNNVLGG